MTTQHAARYVTIDERELRALDHVTTVAESVAAALREGHFTAVACAYALDQALIGVRAIRYELEARSSQQQAATNAPPPPAPHVDA